MLLYYNWLIEIFAQLPFLSGVAMNFNEIRNRPAIPVRELQVQSRDPKISLWADQPASDWCYFHAHIWNAMRTNNWSDMPFDPITLMREEGFEPFPDAIGAFAGLSDVLAVGGKFQHPADALFAYRMKGVLDSGHTPEFWDFWQPMLDEYEVWALSGAMEGVVPLRRHSVAFKDQLDSIQDNTLKSERFEGGWDPLHLTSHAWRPFRRAFLEETEARVDISGQDFYRVLTTDSYAGWARALMDHSFERSTLIRIDVNLDTTGPREPLFVTLGHVLAEPVPRLISTDDYRYEDDDDLQSQCVIRYLNDSQVQELVKIPEAKRMDPAQSLGEIAENGRFYGFTFIYTTPDRRAKEGRLFGTEALVLVTDGTQHKFILPFYEGGNWYRMAEEDINEIIGGENLFDWDEAGMAPKDVAQLVLDHEGERVRLDEEVRVFESSDAMENVRLVVSDLFGNGFYTVEVVPDNYVFSRE